MDRGCDPYEVNKVKEKYVSFSDLVILIKNMKW